MRKSVFFRRVLAILLLALLLWALLTAVLYTFLSRPVFMQIKAREMQPKAEMVATRAAAGFLVDDVFFDSILLSSQELFNAWIFVIDGLSGDVRNASLPSTEAEARPVILEQIKKNNDRLLSGNYNSLWFTARLPKDGDNSEAFFIGVPIRVRFGRQDSVIGTVFFVASMDEMNAGFHSINIALIFSSLIVLILMVLPVWFITARLIRPLRQTRNVALAIAHGDFSVRADAGQVGEIGELAGIMNDLADKLSASIADLTLERNRLRQILAGMSEGLLAIDHNGRITSANPALLNLMALDTLPSIGSPLAEQPVLMELSEPLMQVMVQKIDTEQTLSRHNRILAIQMSPLCEPDGPAAGAVALIRDITEAERLEQTRRDYVANVSHELRTPLTAIRALVEPMRDGLVQSENDRQRYYTIILAEIVRLSRLINDMLELSRLQAGSLVIQLRNFELGPLLEDVGDRFRLQAEDQQITLSWPENLSALPVVHANLDRVEQVLIILLDNAFKYTPSGGSVALQVAWDERTVKISVTDTGIGIHPADIDAVFDRFYKADKAHQQPGTGLGLAIARELLQQMGQDIMVTSQLGKGSTFTFTLARGD
ncbi:MAG: cell wall metabolism sensor histidine kinase WalK [Clostridiaceae bacterium]|nr:cell wall metabolism sensor histidine kinase WalK [Clostridiaceae bacterium]